MNSSLDFSSKEGDLFELHFALSSCTFNCDEILIKNSILKSIESSIRGFVNICESLEILSEIQKELK